VKAIIIEAGKWGCKIHIYKLTGYSRCKSYTVGNLPGVTGRGPLGLNGREVLRSWARPGYVDGKTSSDSRCWTWRVSEMPRQGIHGHIEWGAGERRTWLGSGEHDQITKLTKQRPLFSPFSHSVTVRSMLRASPVSPTRATRLTRPGARAW